MSKKAVILAGGLGSRLKPFTEVIPKALLPIGEKAVLEIQIENLRKFNFKEIIIATNYKSEYIKNFFGDGSRYGVKLTISKEDKPLGTAGPLKLIQDQLQEPFLVMNGDVLTTINYAELIKQHKESGAVATIALNRREVGVDFGVARINNSNELVGWDEKPTLEYLVSMGVYVFEPRTLKYIKAGKSLDIPDLMRGLIERGEKVKGYIYDGYWLDIGRSEDYEKACMEVNGVLNELLGDAQ